MLILRPLFVWIRFVETDRSPWQLCVGLILGSLLGLSPFFTLNWAIFFFLCSAIRINLGVALVAYVVSLGFGMLLAPVFHLLGNQVLTQESLQTYWAWMFHAPVIPYTHFNNTVVIGGLLFGLALTFFTLIFGPAFVKGPGKKMFFRFKESYFGRRLIESRIRRMYLRYLNGDEYQAI